MTDQKRPSDRSNDPTGVSPDTVEHAYRHVRALEADGIPVETVVFDDETDTYHVRTTNGVGGTDPQAIGGGTIKSA